MFTVVWGKQAESEMMYILDWVSEQDTVQSCVYSRGGDADTESDEHQDTYIKLAL